MLKKDQVLATIQSLPEQFSMDDLFERLIILEKIERGLQEVSEGKTMSIEEAKEKIRKWQK